MRCSDPRSSITIVFFYWPATQALWQSFLLQDAFGLSTIFVGWENYRTLFGNPEYYHTVANTLLFSTVVAVHRCRSRSCSRCRPTSRCAAAAPIARC